MGPINCAPNPGVRENNLYPRVKSQIFLSRVQEKKKKKCRIVKALHHGLHNLLDRNDPQFYLVLFVCLI